MVISWFKSRKEQASINGKSDFLSNRDYCGRNNNTHPKLGILEVIRNYSGLHKHSNDITSNNSNGNRTRLFFIGRQFANKEKREKKLKKHYDKLRSVLKQWLKQTAILEQRKDGFPEPPRPLYVNIADTITNPIHYSRIKDHFGHTDYKEINQIINHILEREPKHNENVAEFMKTTERRISKRLESWDDSACGGCVIESIKEHKLGQGVPAYVLEAIVQYFWNKSYQISRWT